MLALGTLGSKWNRWEASTSGICDCQNCCVLHHTFADIMVFGQCPDCPRVGNDWASKRINLFQATLGTDFHALRLRCGHRPVGLTRIWINLKDGVKGVFEFDIRIQCQNPRCTGDPGLLLAFEEAGQHTKEIKAARCCDRPMLNLQGLFVNYREDGEVFQVRVKSLRYCQDTIACRFHHGDHKGIFIGDTAKELIEERTTPAAIPPIEVRALNNRFSSFGNRRLWAFKQYQHHVGPSFDIKVPVKLNQRGSTRLVGKRRDRFTTRNEGASIQVICPQDCGSRAQHAREILRLSSS